ncbi:aminotransferase class III-fold pyridoxal phosphate-dependent enzyme [Acrocarpospora catenulata]|uniref:aminotransferase class III-fold pyridoxal phosphate-dependent enzyme n=1 Tax=Acrocarpospora catenulata TaxID=2836182 RepID=UPI002023A96B|nr:aminotransferase class III-fold pyridoxal phosphate-dependent enzyme [Acrocarpospora catenulata]
MTVHPAEVRASLARHVQVSTLDVVVDLARSQGSQLVDARTGEAYLDLLSFYGSLPLGLNHPALAEPEFVATLVTAAAHKVTNPDLHTVEYARFVETFVRVLGDPALPHLFFIDGGALAVENALKIAFDWKSRRTGQPALEVMHLRHAFHGRSGYTMSLTNTDPAVTDRYPAWRWPRLDFRDGLRPAADYLAAHADRVACFIAEPIQGAGGDNHVDPAFLRGMQELCHRHDVLFVLDEVQTGCGASGTRWTYEQLGLAPDVVAFGKRTQVCGVMAGRRVDETGNVFTVPSRLGSTWGGNLADMVRATRILEVVERDRLIPRTAALGGYLLELVQQLGLAHPGLVANPRGRGLMAAFDLPDAGTRAEFLRRMRVHERVLLLPGGERAVRFRPALTISRDELAKGAAAADRVLSGMGAS